MPVTDCSAFRSPVRKLLSFFVGSRDKWKAKCKAAKRQNKSLRICLAKMKEKRDLWKARAIALEEEFKREANAWEASPARGGTCPS
jgi:hypothetical protein